MKLQDWRQEIKREEFSQVLNQLYGPDHDGRHAEQRDRYEALLDEFQAYFAVPDDAEIRLFSTPGRSEIAGNHTDHQQGRVLACSVDLDILGAVKRVEEPVIRVKSREFEKVDEIDLADLSPRVGEKEHSAALIRGIAAQLQDRGYELGGCEIYTISRVPKGSGLSSSAAFEVLLVSILDELFGEGDLPALERAKIAQYAENVYFGKPSGLMDQCGCAVGGLIALDFKDLEDPQLRELELDFQDFGCDLVITQCPGDHAELTHEYAAVPAEMLEVAEALGQSKLRFARYEDFLKAVPELHGKISDRAILRAYHFFTEDQRVPRIAEALEQGDRDAFFRGIVESGRSSWMYLQNLYSSAAPQFQSLGVGLMLSEALLSGKGAWRVHGGGFAGTIQAFVRHEDVARYRETLDGVFGEGSCQVLTVRPVGSVCLDRLV